MRRRGRAMKRDTVRAHARRRARQRYGILLTDAVEREIIAEIRSGRSQRISRQSHRVSLHRVNVDGELADVVYDSIRKQIVTFLPRPE